MKHDEIKIEIFDFKKDWHLVEPQLNDPEVLNLLNQGMLEFTIHHGWKDLPLWNPNDDSGPWQYAIGDGHVTYAMEKANEDPQHEALNEKYSKICENEGIEFEDIFYQQEEENPKISKLFDNYQADFDKIEEKYLPQKNTYRWYQCSGACFYLDGWQLALAIKVFPNYEWRTFKKSDAKKDCGHSTTIGKDHIGDYIIFDILLFDKFSVYEILESVGLNRNKLKTKVLLIAKEEQNQAFSQLPSM